MSEHDQELTGDVTAEVPVETSEPELPEKLVEDTPPPPKTQSSAGRSKWKPVEVKTDSSKCNMCKKTVYPMEKITADSIVYHTTCFRCSDCNGRLSLGKFAQANGFLYCIHHYSQIFRLKGNYEDGFDGSSSRSKRTLGAADSGTHRK